MLKNNMISNIFCDFDVRVNSNIIDNEYGTVFKNLDVFPLVFIKINENDEDFAYINDELVLETNSDIPLLSSYAYELVYKEDFYDQITVLAINLPFTGVYPKELKTLVVYGIQDGFVIPDCDRVFLFDFKEVNFKIGKIRKLFLIKCKTGNLELPEGIIEIYGKKFNGTLKFPSSLKIVNLNKLVKIPDLNNVENLSINNYDGDFEPSDKLIKLSMEKYTGVNKPIFKARNITKLKLPKYKGEINGKFKILVNYDEYKFQI